MFLTICSVLNELHEIKSKNIITIFSMILKTS